MLKWLWVFGLFHFFLCHGCSLKFNWDVLTLIVSWSWMPLAHWVSRNWESCGKGCFSIWYNNNFCAPSRYVPAHNPFGVICCFLGGLFCLKIFIPTSRRKFSRKEMLANQESSTLWNCMQLYRRQVSPQRILASLILFLIKAGKSSGLGSILRIVGRAQEWKNLCFAL